MVSKKIDEQLAEVQIELNDLRAEYAEFAYMVSHELAAPFRQIEGFASIISSSHADQFDEKTKRHFELIIKGSEKGSRIVEALLAYSRLSTQEFRKQVVDCKQIIDEVMLQLSLRTSDKKVTFTHSDMPVIEGDSAQLYLLFYHLIHNGFHYHKPDSQPVVSIEVAESGKYWDFCISDNGIGISATNASKVFTALKRAVSDKHYDGLGMGLTIARHVVRNHGGKIWLQADISDGCAIRFMLPRQMG